MTTYTDSTGNPRKPSYIARKPRGGKKPYRTKDGNENYLRLPAAKDVMGGFIRDLRDGKSASEALANALSKVGDRLLERVRFNPVHTLLP